MTRLLFWIALAILVVMAIRSKLREIAAKQPGSPAQRGAGTVRSSEVESERMTSCAHCGVFFPASEAVTADGRDYCCPAHVRQPPK